MIFKGKKIGLAVCLVVMMAVPLLTTPNTVAAVEPAGKGKLINIAHRGASGYAPENTIAAYDLAVKMKSDYFEVDVQRSKDGELVILHDTTVDRTTNGTGKVGDLTLAELKSLDAGSWFSPRFQGEEIPTLEEILDRYKGKRSGILIELKNPELYPGIEKQLADLLKKKRMHKRTGKVIVQSFNHESIQTYHQIQPSVPLGVLISYTQYKNGISDEQIDAFASYAQYFNPNKSLVDSDLVKRVHQRGLKIFPYTIQDKEAADQLIKAGVDGIITDYPELGYRRR